MKMILGNIAIADDLKKITKAPHSPSTFLHVGLPALPGTWAQWGVLHAAATRDGGVDGWWGPGGLRWR